MTTFTDRNGTVRTIELHLLKLGQISDSMGVKVHDINELATISDNLIKQCELLWLASDAGEPFEEFAKSLTLQSVEAGMDAFIEELCDVLPSRHSAVLREAQQKNKAMREKLTAKAIEILRQPA